MTRSHANLIFDIGAHTGEDTDFYLGKGFRVVAVEANPKLAERLRSRFAGPIRDGALEIVEKAILPQVQDSVSFFINESHDDWSSVHHDVATKGSMAVTEVKVEVTTLLQLCTDYGLPYYLKVDIELGDLAVAESLPTLPELPPYSSFEFHEDRMLDLLHDVGYTEFQIVNQWFNGFTKQVSPALEGIDYWPGRFTGFHSGYFGRELPAADWVGFAEAKAWREALTIACRHGLMASSWFDLHARTAAASAVARATP